MTCNNRILYTSEKFEVISKEYQTYVQEYGKISVTLSEETSLRKSDKILARWPKFSEIPKFPYFPHKFSIYCTDLMVDVNLIGH